MDSYDRIRRDREIERRRRIKQLRRRRQLFVIYCVLCLVAVAAIVFFVSRIKKSFAKKSDEEITTVISVPTPEKEDKNIQDEIQDDKEDSFLGFNEAGDSKRPVVHGIEIFKGYQINKTDSTYYISSENMMSTYAILVDAKDGTVVCQKEGFTRINPASMTKILTALVAAEHLDKEDLDKKVTITVEETDYAFTKKLSAVNFDVGEEVTVRDLFYGTILPSGADAAIALAKYVAGDEESFVKMMNEKIDELGISDTTHFTNCVGTYDEDHYSTCADMAVILKAAIENDFVYDVMNAHIYTTSQTPTHPDGIEISNWFLRRIEDKDTNGEVLCAKTGFVNESGSCAASYEVTKTGHPYICVTADAHSAWRCIYDHVDIYANFTE
ncbi:MAG: serine hydrolase [Lachnospiraceae bacterium]|nr:serine hydrolase [Lachnospiraceae bacterium]